MKRLRARRSQSSYISSYRGKNRWRWMQLPLAGVLAMAGLALVIVRVWGMRFSGFLLLGIAALLGADWLLTRWAEWSGASRRCRLARRIFRSCAAAGLALLLGLEAVIITRGRSDMTPLPADAVIVLGAGVNGTEPSLSLQTRLDKALDYLERWPDIPAVLTGGTGYGEEISEAACMYDYLTEHGVEPERLILEDRASNTAENFAFSKELLAEAGVDPATDKVAVITNDFHLARAELIAARQGYGDTAGVPAPLPWPHLTVNYYLRESFAMVKSLAFD